MTDHQSTALLVYNPRSGPEAGGFPSAIPELVEKSAGRPLNLRTVDVCEQSLDKDDIKAAEMVIIWGGDGTVSRFLSEFGSMKPVAILPGGTMNILYKEWIGDPQHWRSYLSSVLRDPRTKHVPAGSADGHLFFVAAAFGQLTRLADAREALRDGEPMKALSHVVESPVFDFGSELLVEFPGDDHASEPVTAVWCVVNDADPPQLTVGSLGISTFAELGNAAITALLDTWKSAPQVDVKPCTMFSVRGAREDKLAARCILDGEPRDMALPVKIRVHPEAATILCL